MEEGNSNCFLEIHKETSPLRDKTHTHIPEHTCNFSNIVSWLLRRQPISKTMQLREVRFLLTLDNPRAHAPQQEKPPQWEAQHRNEE